MKPTGRLRPTFVAQTIQMAEQEWDSGKSKKGVNYDLISVWTRPS